MYNCTLISNEWTNDYLVINKRSDIQQMRTHPKTTQCIGTVV